ncbi:CLUMA_CG015211, isoform A, partial [Clunio marinus]
ADSRAIDVGLPGNLTCVDLTFHTKCNQKPCPSKKCPSKKIVHSPPETNFLATVVIRKCNKIFVLKINSCVEMILRRLNILKHRGLFVKNRQVLLVASYSRNSSNSKSPYKIIQAKIKNASNEEVPHENGLNWELFGPRNNRFFLASGSVGPAYMNSKTTLASNFDLEQLLEEIKASGANENCLLISEDKSSKFSGSLFSNIPPNLEMVKELILD